MFRPALILTLSLGCVAACAQNPGTQASSANASPARTEVASVSKSKDSDPNERVCEKREVPGSIIPQKVCMTRAEKEELRKQAQESVNSSQRSSLRTCTAGAGCGGG